MYIRKFYDAASAEPAAAAAPTTPRFEVTGQEIPLNDIFEGMKSVPAEPPATPEPPAATPEPPKADLPVTPEPPATIEPPAPVATPITDWKEVIKKQNLKDIFSLLEIDEDALNLSKQVKGDEFVQKLVTYRKEHGNVTPFIEAATKDWDKASHKELIMDDLKKQYSSISPEKAEKLANSDYNQRFVYKDDPLLSEAENAEKAELMGIKLEADSERIRLARKTEQKTFLDGVKPIDRSAEVSEAAKARLQADLQELNEFTQTIETNPATIKLFSERKIVLGDKDDSFNYSVNPDAIKEKTLDTNKFYGKFWSEDGKTFNVAKWNKVVAYSEDDSAFEAALINHGRSLENKKIEKELENTVKPNQQQQQAPGKKSLAKTFAEGGQPITLQELYGS